jgi:hypothetical protein
VKPFQSPPPHITRADVPLSTLRERMTALVERQKQDAAAERLRLLLAEQPCQHATPGEAAEYRHLLYDADPDASIPAFPYPAPKESS